MTALERTSKAIADAHDWMTEDNAVALLVHAYWRFQGEARNHDEMIEALMMIEFGVLLNCPEEELRNRLAVAQEWVG